MSFIGRGGHSKSRARRFFAAWLAVVFAFAPLAELGAAVAGYGAPTVTSAAVDTAALAPARHASLAVRPNYSVILSELSRLAESKPGLPAGKPPLPDVEPHRLDLILDGRQLVWNGFAAGLAHRVDARSHPPTGPPV